MQWYIFNPSNWQAEADGTGEIQATVVYIVGSRLARAT